MIGCVLLGLAAALVCSSGSRSGSTNGSPRRGLAPPRSVDCDDDDPELERLGDERDALQSELGSLKQDCAALERDLVNLQSRALELRRQREQAFAKARRRANWGLGCIAIAALAEIAVVMAGPDSRVPFTVAALAAVIAAAPFMVVGWSLSVEARALWKTEMESVAEHERAAQRLAPFEARRRAAAGELVRVSDQLAARRQELENQRFADRDRQRIAREETVRQAAQEGAEQQRARRNTAIVQGALVWWSTQLPQADRFVEVHWRELIGSENALLAQYTDPTSPCSTMEGCLDVARWALCERRAELGYHLPGSELSVEALALLLRWHHGFAVEYLLPQARAIELRRLLTPRRKPRPPKQIAASATEAPLQQLESDPATHTSPLEEFYAGLPARIREDLKGFDRHFEKVQTREQLERFKQAYAETRRTEFEASGRRAELIEEDMEALDYNLDQAIKAWARSRGLK